MDVESLKTNKQKQNQPTKQKTHKNNRRENFKLIQIPLCLQTDDQLDILIFKQEFSAVKTTT